MKNEKEREQTAGGTLKRSNMEKKIERGVSALDVAKYVLSVAYDNGDLITNLKLQKLLYYVQARYLAKHEDAFF